MGQSEEGKSGTIFHSNNMTIARSAGRIHHSFTVTYSSNNNWSVLTQRWGSNWPRLLPYCLFNAMLMALLHILLDHGINLEISDQGHIFMSFLLSFLLVGRIAMSLGRYDEAREYLELMNKSCRQLVHTVCVYSNADTTDSAKQWRSEVTYRTLILLRTAIAVLDFASTGRRVKELPELGGEVLHDLQNNLPPDRWLHEPRSDYEENIRVPIRLSYLLRKSIRSQERRITPNIPVVAEGDLYSFLNSLMDGYYGVHKLMTTPVPFPLIQMITTLLCFYLFTVPFALLSAGETSMVAAISHCMVVFILTFGFVGMNMVSMQLDDPFGVDENDFK